MYSAYVLLSNTYRKMGKNFAAEKALQKACLADAQNPIAYELLCELHEDAINIDAINHVLTKAKEKLIDLSPALLYFKGQLLFREENFQGCLEALSTPKLKVSNVSSLSSALQLKGRCHDKLGNYHAAFSLLQK